MRLLPRDVHRQTDATHRFCGQPRGGLLVIPGALWQRLVMDARYRSGEVLYGDDFSPTELQEWFADEREGYARLVESASTSYEYGYHCLNVHHGFRLLDGRWKRALGFGSAFGDELRPVVDRIDEIVLLDASESFDADTFPGRQVTRARASESGTLEFPDGHFDLITCFGVLHHIPNVSYVLSELRRCLAPGGVLLIREPTTSMGDWTKPRPRLTARERGISKRWMIRTIERLNFELISVTDCMFTPLGILLRPIGASTFSSSFWTAVDAVLARSVSWNDSYFAESSLAKLRPGAAYYVVRRPVDQ